MKFLLTSYSSEPSKNRAGSIRDLAPDEYDPSENYLLLKNPSIRIVCDSCLRNITISCHIACEDNDYCVGCFVELREPIRQYSIRSTLKYSLTEPNWLCLDEILLMAAFQKWGFGNWSEVKDFMNFNGTKFTRQEIQKHYDQYYLETDDLFPKITHEVIHATKLQMATQPISMQSQFPQKQDKKPLLQLKSEEQIIVPKKPAQLVQNILGYNPKRKSFSYDLEYDQKAEAMLSDLQFKDDDTPEEIQLKFRILENYNRRQDERLKRYQFTIEHHILDIDYRFRQQFSANKYQKQAFLLYRPFTRFQTHDRNQETMGIIARNDYYKSLIQGLKKCRKKIDKEGRIDTTLQYLRAKDPSLEKLGNPRKMFKLSLATPSQDEVSRPELLAKIADLLKTRNQLDNSHSLRFIQEPGHK